MISDSGEKRVQIALKALPTAIQRALPPNLPSTIQTEYASRYCESIGVTADKEAVEYFLSVMPVKDALVAPNWTTSTLEIIPGRGNETAAQTQMRLAREKESILGGGKKRASSPSGKTWEPYDFSDTGIKKVDKTDPTSGAISGRKKAVGAKKAVSKNTLSFRLLVKTLCEVGVGDLEVMKFRELLKPVTFDSEDVGCALRSFFECMPAFVPQFKDEGEIPPIHLKVIKFLRDPICESFFGLLLRYAYWNVIHPIARAVLKNGKLSHPEMFNNSNSRIDSKIPTFQNHRDYSDDDSSTTNSSTNRSVSVSNSEEGGFYLTNESLASETSLGCEEKETLFVKLENCLNKLSKRMNFNYADMSVGQRAFVACCHFVCDEIIKVKYQWFILEAATLNSKNKAAEETRARAAFITSQNLDYCRLQFQKAVHESLSDLLDPIRIYGTNLVRKEIVENMLPSGMSTKIRGQYHMTSAAVQALMGSARSPEARRFLSRCETSSYIPLPGSIPMDAKKQDILRGTSFNKTLLPPELTWKGTVVRPSTSAGSISVKSSSSRPFHRTLIKKEHMELPLSTAGKNALFAITKEKQKGKYSGHRMDKFSRVPDVQSRTVLLDDRGDTMVGSPGRYTSATGSPGGNSGFLSPLKSPTT